MRWLAQQGTGAIQKKVDPPRAGDHSPSIVSVNRARSGWLRISGRGGSRPTSVQQVHEDEVPTLQFDTDFFRARHDVGRRVAEAGRAAHSIFTSLRTAGGAGERDTHGNLDDLLDHVRQSYSSYIPETGETDDNEPKLAGLRVNVFSPRNRDTNRVVLHRSSAGVQPLVAQTMINLWYRAQRSRPAAGDERSALPAFLRRLDQP